MTNPFDGFERKFKQTIEEVSKPSNMQELGEEVKSIIKKRTRLGYGVEATGQERVALKALSQSYKEFRKELGATKKSKAKFKASQLVGGESVKLSNKDKKRASKESKIKLSDATSPTKSNLTLTGQLLDSLTVEAGQGQALVTVEGIRDDGQSNKEVARKVQEEGRPFLDLAKGDLNQLKVKLSAMVNRIFKTLK